MLLAEGPIKLFEVIGSYQAVFKGRNSRSKCPIRLYEAPIMGFSRHSEGTGPIRFSEVPSCQKCPYRFSEGPSSYGPIWLLENQRILPGSWRSEGPIRLAKGPIIRVPELRALAGS